MRKFTLKENKWYFQSLWNTKSVKVVDNDWKEAVEIEWYASTKDKDRVGDIVEPKAFERALEQYMLNPIVLLQHKTDKPIWVVEETNIDDNWLFIKAKITENTDWVIDQIKNWVLRSFSIWYRVKDYDTDVRELANWDYDFTNIIKDLELFEISVVSVPANPYALVKSFEDLLEVKEVEEVEPDKVSEVMEHEIAESQDVNENEQNENNDSWEAEEQWKDKVEEEAESEIIVEEEKEEDEIEEKETEEIVADENSEIVETEVEEVSENEVETPTNDVEVDETRNENVVETKSIEVETKSFNFDEKIAEMQKSFDEQLSKKDIEIKELKSKVDNMSKLFAESLEAVDKLATKINNIPVAKWLAYTRPARKSGYGLVAEALKNL